MKSALINIDVQSFYASESPKTTAAIEQFTNSVRGKMPIIWVCMDWVNLKDAFSAVALENPPPSVEFNERMKPALIIHAKDFIQPKLTMNAFEGTNFKKFLQSQGIRKIYIAGFQASQCVQSTAFAADKNLFETVILSDLVSDRFDQKPSKSLINLYEYKDVKAINSQELKL